MSTELMTKRYEFTVVATDVVIFSVQEKNLRVLLIEMKKSPFQGSWAVPGGLVKSDESLSNAAKRILSEKAGVTGVYLEQLAAFGEPNRDPFGRVVSVAYFSLIPSDQHALQTTSEYADIRWFPVRRLPKLAYDHQEVIRTAMERLRAKLAYTTIARNLLPQEFSLSDLQAIYEIILGKLVDKRNFRKKILGLGLVKSVGKKRRGGASRPAELYRFSRSRTEMIDIL